MSKSYLIVFHGDYDKFCQEKKIIDISDDPCFDKLPTWGICRPPTRKSIDIGDKMFFVAFYKKTKEYYLKGWFTVGEKISYTEALERFPQRLNVIISTTKRQKKNTCWRYKELETNFKNKYGDTIPDWLISIKTEQGTFYQSGNDNHKIDNWKCRRIFHCTSKQFNKCISNNCCEKDGNSLEQYKNYIVSHRSNWQDIGSKLINFNSFKKQTGVNLNLCTPKGQHNVLSVDFSLLEFTNFFQNINN